MTEPRPLPDDIWKDAEALVERVERAARNPSETFFQDLADGIRLTAGAAAVILRSVDRQQANVLAQAGFSIRAQAANESSADRTTDDEQRQCFWQADDQVTALQRMLKDLRLELELRFDQPVPLALRQALEELSEVVVEMASNVFLRIHMNQLRSELGDQRQRDQLITRLSAGVGLRDSFTGIVSAIASEMSVDRVSLLQQRGSGYRLITSSTQPKVDRRSRQAQRLERMASSIIDHNHRFTFLLGDAFDTRWQDHETVHAYFEESGCRELYLAGIPNSVQPAHEAITQAPIAVIVLERFRGTSEEDALIDSRIETIRKPVEAAVQNAIAREDAGWGLIASRLAGDLTRRRCWASFGGVCLLCLVAFLVPAKLRIPAEGRVVASQTSHLYASTDGVVDEVLVDNGQSVQAGTPLLILRSPQLDLQQRNLQASLATARTRLESLVALRTRSSSQTKRAPSSSAEENVIETEIAGIAKQLQLIQEQQAALTICSPADGIVDRWDLRPSLTARPVTHGQYLLDVVSER
ncbi:MAG: biotin/lipoyl-binding protein, partial [Rubripirellula sp.]